MLLLFVWSVGHGSSLGAETLPESAREGKPDAMHQSQQTHKIKIFIASLLATKTSFVRSLFRGRIKTTILKNSMSTIKKQTIDLIAFCQAQGSAAKEALAKRIFAIWSPLFPHVLEHGPSYMSTRYVEDPKGIYRHATFYSQDGIDRGLVIVRIYEQKAEEKPFLRLTVGAGIHPEIAGRDTTYFPVFRAVLWALLRRPRVPIYLMDVVVSPGAWRSSYRWLPNLRPQPGAWISDECWPVAQAGMQAIGAVPVEGKPRGVVHMRGFVSQEAKQRVTRASPESLRAEEAFSRWVGEGEGVFVCAQISPQLFVSGTARGLFSRLRHRLRGDKS